jgi:hypothetical protein
VTIGNLFCNPWTLCSSIRTSGFCAVDTTSGLDHEKHSVLEVCVLPLNSDYSINRSILPFNMQMQPIPGKEIDREAMTINKLDIVQDQAQLQLMPTRQLIFWWSGSRS